MELAAKVIIGKIPDHMWARKFILSLLVPAAILLFCPFGLVRGQAALFACIVLVILWWSFGVTGKVFASCFLLAAFLVYGIAPKTVFSFPLSNTFLLIVLCYVFSRGVTNADIAQKTLGPLLFRYVNTPVKAILASISVLLLGIPLIPQPLARLLLTVCLIRGYLDHTDAKDETKRIVVFSIYVFYAAVNMLAMRADLILNSSAVGFAGLNITEGGWLRAMAIPTTVYCLLVFGLFCVLFGKKLFGVRLRATESNEAQLGNSALAPADKRMLAVMLGTVLLWATESLHGLNASLVTLAAILLMFLNGNLRLQDLRSIDVTTLIFLTAAFSIGGSMKASGIAEHVFGTLAAIFPKSYSVLYILTIVGVSMVMHLILGSNTTSLSIVLPGLIAICSSVVPAQEVFFLVFFTVAAQYILPFHSVAMMIGVSNGDFPAPYVTRFGVPLSILLLASVFCIYIPWWHLIGMI